MCADITSLAELLQRGSTDEEKVYPVYSEKGSRAALIERPHLSQGRYQTMIEEDGGDRTTHMGNTTQSHQQALQFLGELEYYFPHDPTATYTTITPPDVQPVEKETIEAYQQFVIDGKTLLQWWQLAAFNTQLGPDAPVEKQVHPAARVQPTDSFTSLRRRLVCTVASLSDIDVVRLFAMLTEMNPLAAALLQIPLGLNEAEQLSAGERLTERQEVVS